MSSALSTRLPAPFDEGVARTREALIGQGFGVITEINMTETLKAKLGIEMEDYLILGACNPALAYEAISIDRQIGLLLPCNVLVRADPDDPATVIVEAMDPGLLLEVTGEPALKQIADDVSTRLGAAITSLNSRLG